ncbi:MAG: 2-hydroxyacyl-CoA dehydratase family protein [Dehalococcoidia bacterium]|jgi:hypothetical protein
MQNLLQKLIDKKKKMLAELDAHPDPKMMPSMRMALEIEIEGYGDLLEYAREGKPILGHFPSNGLARAMGALPILYQDPLLCDPDPEIGIQLYQVARDMGMPDYMCDVFTLPAAAVKAGMYAPPKVATSGTGGACRVWMYHMKAFAQYFAVNNDIPTFEFDTPHDYSLDSISYMADQLADYIKFVEKNVPGTKYDEEEHLKIIEANKTWINYTLKDFELKKNVPMGLSNMENAVLPLHFDPSLFGKREKVLEFWKQRVKDTEARIAQGGNKNEKLRILWLNPIPLYMDLFSLLDDLGISMITWIPPLAVLNGWRAKWGDEKEFGRKLTPLEEEARFMFADIYGTKEWADEVVWMCKELKCDAVVYYQLVGCIHIGAPFRMVADTVKEQLGLPTLVMPGRLYDPTIMPAAEIEDRLRMFADSILAGKK